MHANICGNSCKRIIISNYAHFYWQQNRIVLLHINNIVADFLHAIIPSAIYTWFTISYH